MAERARRVGTYVRNRKPLKRLVLVLGAFTGLKAGDNEKTFGLGGTLAENTGLKAGAN
jgi:hypothetical protein